MNRESWLTEVARQVEPLFKGFRLGPYRVSCSWPTKHALGVRVRRLGECHAAESSSGGFHELFISPVMEDPAEVAGTVVHELAHVAATIPAGHGKGFVKVCRHVGLTKGKPAQAAPGPFLAERLAKIASRLGTYPHKAVAPAGRVVRASPRITLRCLREGCGCLVNISVSWLDKAGPPVCGCGGPMVPKLAENDR